MSKRKKAHGVSRFVDVKLLGTAKKFQYKYSTNRNRPGYYSGNMASILTESAPVLAKRRAAQELEARKQSQRLMSQKHNPPKKFIGDAAREISFLDKDAARRAKRERKFQRKQERIKRRIEYENGSPTIKAHASRMTSNPTKAETCMGSALSKIGVRFKQQYIVGLRILDFYLPDLQIAIEADGSQHFTKEGIALDNLREKHILKINPKIRFIRYTNNFIINDVNFLTHLRAKIASLSPQPPQPPAGAPKTEFTAHDGRVEHLILAS